MSVLNINALGITLSDMLFADLSFTVSEGDRIGLVAANGRGKSSLLSCIFGEFDQTSGEITRRLGLRIGYLRQTIPDHALELSLHDWVRASLPPEQADYESWRVDVVLSALNIPGGMYHTTLGRLSGGWQRLAMLAGVWITEPDMLLLDEPTNHLDLWRIGFLQHWLATLPKDLPIIMTSHDRAFLDVTTNRTLFLRPKDSRIFTLPFSTARTALDESDAADERSLANDLKEARHMRE